MAVIPALGCLKPNLGYIARPCLKKRREWGGGDSSGEERGGKGRRETNQ
jgi:hypothetical protein